MLAFGLGLTGLVFVIWISAPRDTWLKLGLDSYEHRYAKLKMGMSPETARKILKPDEKGGVFTVVGGGIGSVKPDGKGGFIVVGGGFRWPPVDYPYSFVDRNRKIEIDLAFAGNQLVWKRITIIDMDSGNTIDQAWEGELPEYSKFRKEPN
jgi:hypothetical protein